MRLQKYLAECGVASRRNAEELMKKGMVTVNGVTADKPGVKVSDGDKVMVCGKQVRQQTKKIYILLNKPIGYVTTSADNFGRKTVIDLIKNEINTRVFPVGRLDINSEGLLLLTNDGNIAYALTHPKYNIPKTYIVELDGAPSKWAIDKLKKGVLIDGAKTKPAKVKQLTNSAFEITITEGKNRQIRKMAQTIGFEVVSLKRVSIGLISLGNIPLGRWRHLTKTELNFLTGLTNPL